MENIKMNKHSNEQNVRIPKNFIPLKYDLDFYIDIKNITFTLINEIHMEIENESSRVVVLNALPSAFKIKKIKVFRHDRISDHDIYEGECIFNYSKDIYTILGSIEIKNKFRQLFGDIDLENSQIKEEKLLNILLQGLYEEYGCWVDNSKQIILHEDLKLLNYLKGIGDLKVIEESVYISLPDNLKIVKGDIIKLSIDVEGEIYLSSEKKCGLYLCLLGNDAKLLDNRQEFLKIWQDDDRNQELIKNFVISALNEPVDCRTYIPSFDEPCYKAKFNMKITVDSKFAVENNYFKVLSNGDLLDIIPNSETNKLTYVFSESPLMSTYLLTFVIGNFEYLESMVGKIRLRVYTPVSSQIEGSFALEIAKKSLDFYQKYFKIPYSFPKVDLVPVPAMDYRAMENWGCIVYLNYALMAHKLIDIKERKNIARTNCHELSHMWFGNLVTMDWWDDIWLNEGFARYMEFECIEEIKPEFEIWSKYIELIYQNAMEIDESPTTHPVRCDVPSPRSLMDIFDTISYAKGASMIRMLSYFVGKEKFRTTILLYLENFQYKNTKTEDLWRMFKEITETDVKEIMDVWLNYSGHPALKVSLETKSEQAILVLEQNPFPTNFNSSLNNPLWKIPLFIKTKTGEYNFLMKDRRVEINIKETLYVDYQELINNKDYIKVNSDMKGFYRVFYNSEVLLDSLLTNHRKLTKFDISGLISDYFAINDIETCLRILDSIKPIEDYLILFYANKVFRQIKQFLFQFSCFQHFLVEDDFVSKMKYQAYITSENACEAFYGNLISLNIHKLKEKIFVKNSSIYLNEKYDEFEEVALHFYCFAKKDMDIIEYIVTNFEKEFLRIHKNFKYLVYNVIVHYTYKILNDTEKEISFYKMILDEYIDGFYQHSLQTRNEYKLALINLEKSSDNLIDYFTKRFHNDYYFRNLYFKNINLFGLFPKNRLRFIHSYVRLIKETFNRNVKIGLNISFEEFIFSNSHLKLFYYEFPILFNDIFDENLKKKVLDYIVDEIIQIGHVNINIIYNSFKKKITNFEKAENILMKTLNYFNTK